ncbi:hypothetical protein [Pseudomonas sp. SCA2728.1_7]|uniref:hypothetical protein n=1 Tax=Pseudomonas sp. SCA2728.1_7 TaxID=2825975 RepID=UPI001BB017EE|nr:hypothetical protein [Pseudomonas sp. SCA2728.1_7]QUE91264.1 hypothetical protein KBP52_02115 [Pseudomonas sp. SCA2728.1_7]
MAFPESIFVPLGVVSAALIAGAIAYAGFISTKESKVSEFRQNWINGLREEISLYISCIDSLIEHITRDSLKTSKPPSSSLLCKLDHSDLYTTLLKAKTSIVLRINDKEKEREDFERNEKFLMLIELTHKNFEVGKFDEAYKAIQNLTSTSRELLKHEWNRARDGEKKYQEAKAISQWAMGTAGAFLMAILMAVAYESLSFALSTTIKFTESAQISCEK